MKNTEKRILFKASASSEIGLGHFMRTKALAEETSKKIGRENVFLTGNLPSKEDMPENYVFLPEDEKVAELIKNEDIDILLIDEPEVSLALCERVKKENDKILIAALDCFDYNNSFLDKIINLFNYNEPPMKEFKGQYYEGLEYAIVRPSFFKFHTRDKKIKPKVERILIAFGGADPSGNTIKALNILESANFGKNVDLIIGPLFKNKTALLEEIKTKNYTCTVHENVKNIENYMFNADLAIVGSGSTMMELCMVGTPAIVIPQNERELKFAKVFEKREAVKVLDINGKESALLKEFLNNRDLREKLSKNGKKIIDTKGIERIENLILSV